MTLRVLVVEDDGLFRFRVVDHLAADPGLCVEGCSSVDEALAHAAANRFDVAIIDAGLPPSSGVIARTAPRAGLSGNALGGLALARQLRQSNPEVAICIISGLGDPSCIDWCKHNNATFVPKNEFVSQRLREQLQDLSRLLPSHRHKSVLHLMNRFNVVARTLVRQRRESRPTLAIEDEYDVQDLLFSLLHLEFDDVRREEPGHSVAGGTSRVDLLLPNRRLMIEVKHLRKTLKTAELRKQLADDILIYQRLPGYDTLICFVYDPDGMFDNPAGFITDFEERTDLGLRVFVHISSYLRPI